MKKQKTLKGFEKLNKKAEKLNKKLMQTIKGGGGGNPIIRTGSIIIEQDVE